MSIEARCVDCGCPAVDHVPALRYVLRAWARHHLTRRTRKESPHMSDNPDDQEPGWGFLSLFLRPVEACVRAWQWITGLFGRDTKDQP